MVKRILLALLASSAPALAQPAATDPETPPPTAPEATTPTVVAAPPVAIDVAPWILRRGNLRLSIACAETWVTPDDGLTVSVDGQAIDPQRLNGHYNNYVDNDGNDNQVWNATDTGYLLQPGSHHVQIASPGCAPSEFDMTADPAHASHASGRLALDDSSLMGPVGAPNGFGFTAGMWFGNAPMGPTSNSVFNQTAAFDSGHSETGAFLSLSREHRNVVYAVDFAFASGAVSGTVSGQNVFGTTGGQQFTGTAFDSMDQLRVGARLPLRYVALEAGSGVGLDWWTTSSTLVGSQTTSYFAPSGIDASFYLPVWAAATIKPTCDWGLQVMGQYDVHPTSMDTNGIAIAAGVMYQPSASCSEAPGVRVN
jgi:hypothetical protein